MVARFFLFVCPKGRQGSGVGEVHFLAYFTYLCTLLVSPDKFVGSSLSTLQLFS